MGPREREITSCSYPAEFFPSPCEGPLITDRESAGLRRFRVKVQKPTRKFLGSITSEGSFQLVRGAQYTILGALDVAFGLGLLVLDIAFGLTLLARRLPRFKASQVTNLLFELSYGVLDVARSLAVNEPGVSVSDNGEDGRFGRRRR